MSNRDLLKRSRSKVYPVEISTGTVHIKSMNGAARHKYAQLSKGDGSLAPHTIVALALCSEDGTMDFSMETEKDIALANAELCEVDGADLQAICLKFFEVSGTASKSVDDAEKKSEASPSA